MTNVSAMLLSEPAFPGRNCSKVQVERQIPHRRWQKAWLDSAWELDRFGCGEVRDEHRSRQEAGGAKKGSDGDAKLPMLGTGEKEKGKNLHPQNRRGERYYPAR
jgi:hypothetical protein